MPKIKDTTKMLLILAGSFILLGIFLASVYTNILFSTLRSG